MIQRYSYHCLGEGEYNCGKQKDAEGPFVLYEDYQQLEALCRQQAEALQEVMGVLRPRLAAEGGLVGCRDNNLCPACKAEDALQATKKAGIET